MTGFAKSVLVLLNLTTNEEHLLKYHGGFVITLQIELSLHLESKRHDTSLKH